MPGVYTASDGCSSTRAQGLPRPLAVGPLVPCRYRGFDDGRAVASDTGACCWFWTGVEDHEACVKIMTKHAWTLIGRDGEAYTSNVPGTLGGHRGGKLYGRLDCRAAAAAIVRGGYVRQRVFFF
jgi:hypothetical protein